ncbi:leucine carboxyl methyltransferase 1-like [Corticium candelabrum]|uniref:leucine carboxyl methyltransferase 1-like n=1 Tax=Corticium candelabrum TaxID=121492 RepID=UPI002E26AEA9|nr:leucine carboxyl methyltransferase 1-like [Corticium candelabrum]
MAAGVQATNDDATSCKRYAVEKGYWDDPFVTCFSRSSSRRSPEISRGYYARVKAVETFCRQFVDLCNRKGRDSQIVSLGAGFDTLYWRLHAAGRRPSRFVEVDCPPVVRRKVVACQRKKLLSDVIDLDGHVTVSGCGLYSKCYSVVGGDLSDIVDVGKKLMECGLVADVPTFVLAECVLVYLETSQTRRILTWAAETFSTALFLSYEPVNVFDQFGHVMVENLRLRSCALLGADDCESLDRQMSRFRDCGWKRVNAVDMWDVYNMLPADDVQRVERLEFLDEVELLQQLLQHYCISYAVNDLLGMGLGDIRI